MKYFPFNFNNSLWVPFSINFPESITNIASESNIVLNLWATEIQVLPFFNSNIFFCILFSISLSKAEVASSNKIIAGFLKKL